MLESDNTRYCLEMICADFLAGANLTMEIRNSCCSRFRFYTFLPRDQKQNSWQADGMCHEPNSRKTHLRPFDAASMQPPCDLDERRANARTAAVKIT
jgi:hypothetical protein